MAESPPPPVARRPRRWARRLGWATLTTVLLLIGGGVAAWMSRVTLAHRFLNSGDSLWQVEMDSIHLRGWHLEITGLQVKHPDQAEPVFRANLVRTPASWSALKQGQLGAVEVTGPVVYWRAGLRSNPPDPDKPERTGPMVRWDSITLTGGKVDVAKAGAWQFRGLVEGSSGPGAWHSEGRLALAPTTLTIGNAVYAQEFPGSRLARVAAGAQTVQLTGALEAATGLLSIQQSRLTGTKVKLTMAPPSPLPAEPGSSPAEPEEDAGPALISGVHLEDLAAPRLALEADLPWRLTSTGDLTVNQLQAGQSRPFLMSGAGFAAASAQLPDKAMVGQFDLAAAYLVEGPKLDQFRFSGMEVPDVKALLHTMGLALPEDIAASFKAHGEVRELTLRGGRPASSELQSLTLEDLQFKWPGQGEGTLKRAAIEAVPDELTEARRFRRLELDSPVAEWKIAPALAPLPEAAPPAPAETTMPAARPLWEGWTADHLEVRGGELAATLPQVGGARVSSGLAIETTTTGNGAVPADYQITLGQPSLAHPEFPGQPIALAAAIQLTASAAGLWQKREIDSLTLAGTRLQIGEALFRLVNALPPKPVPDPLPPVTSSVEPPIQKSPPWRLKHLVLGDTLIQLEHLGDGRRLEVPIKHQEFHDLPLDATALAAVDRVYKIEVPNITLYSPFSGGQKVAVLDTNYIQFTPSGLLARRLERVDLMAPSLYAGQPLFDFVQAARRRFTELAAAPAIPSADQQPLLVDITPRSPTMLSALARVTPEAAAAAAAWDIPFYTESGKVYVAPKGYPWPNLPVIPFRNARDAMGKPVPFLLQGETFHGELAIEPGWYDFPEYKVRLRLSDRGRIIFNTPQKDRDNNLTEVFENNTLIFRQLRVDQAWLSVTYDARGIYARFGGHTCGGTLTGGINLYLDELYTWDAWASLIGIGMKPLTDKLTPDTFRMTGVVDELTVKAYGDTTTLYQASLDLKVSQPGRLNVLALDSMKDKIDALGGLKADLGQISLATLRDFDYTTCSGRLRLFGSEGQGHLALAGPAGSRIFNLKLHDYRAKMPRTSAPF